MKHLDSISTCLVGFFLLLALLMKGTGAFAQSCSPAPTVAASVLSPEPVCAPSGRRITLTAQGSPGAVATFTNNTPVPTVNQTATSTVVVSGLPAPVPSGATLSVRVTADVPNVHDSFLVLYGPNGQNIFLAGYNALPNGVNYVNTIFADSCRRGISQGSAPFTGVFRPDEAYLQTLLNVVNTDPNGNWTLRLDYWGGGTARIVSWDLIVNAERYNWSGPGGFAATGQTIGVTLPTNLGTSLTYQATYTNLLSGCSSTPGAVTVVQNQPIARPSASPDSWCGGAVGPVQLSASVTAPPGAALSYQWTGPGGFSSTQASPSTTPPAAAGNYAYTLTVTDQNTGCVSAPATVRVAVGNVQVAATGRPSPAASCSTPPGATVQLRAQPDAERISRFTASPGFTMNPFTRRDFPLAVSGLPTQLGASGLVALTLNLDFATDAPEVYLIAPNGTTRFVLQSQTGPNYRNLVLSDTTQRSIGQGVAPYTGVFRPQNASLADFTTGNPNGTWVLRLVSYASTQVTNFSLDFSLNRYAWTGPGGFSSSLMRPTATLPTTPGVSTYSVTLTDLSTGCVSTPATVTYAATQPVVRATATPADVCGTTAGPVQLAASVTAMPGATLSYQWTGPGGFSSTQASPTVTPPAGAGLYNYSLLVTDQTNGCASPPALATVRVQQLALAPSSPTPVLCGPAAASVSLQANPSGLQGRVSQSSTLNATVPRLQVLRYPLAITGAPAYLSSNLRVTVGLNLAMTDNTGSVVLISPEGRRVRLFLPFMTGSGVEFSSTLFTDTTNTIPDLWGTYYSGPLRPTDGLASTLAGARLNGTWQLEIAGLNQDGSVLTDWTLTIAPALTYSWTGPNGFASTRENPGNVPVPSSVSTYAYTVTVTEIGTNCTATGTVTITRQQPQASAAVSQASFCNQTTTAVQLTGTASGFVGSNLGYSWTGPNGFASTQQNPSVTPPNAVGLYTYSLVVTDLNTGCASPAATVSVRVSRPTVVPAVTAGACNGSSLSLAANASSFADPAAIQYSWSGPGGFTSTQANPSVTPPTVGTHTYSLSATDPVSGCVATGSVTVTWQRPVASASASVSSFCNQAPGGVRLNGSATGFVGTNLRYSWTGPNSFSSNQQNPNVAVPNAAGLYTYSLVVTDLTTGCASAAATTQVAVHYPVVAPTSLSTNQCNNGQVQLQANASGFANPAALQYSWTGPAGFSSTQANPSTTLPGPGTFAYSVTVTDPASGCSRTAALSVLRQDPSVRLTANPTVFGALCNPPVGTAVPIVLRARPRNFGTVPVLVNANAGIPDNSAATGPGVATSSTTVSGLTNGTQLSFLTLNINHPRVEDLVVELSYVDAQGRTSRSTVLRQLRNATANLTGTVLSDTAQVSITNGTSPYTGLFRPESGLNNVGGIDCNGTWTLTVTDRVSGNVGTLLNWQLDFARPLTYSWTGPGGFTASGSTVSTNAPAATGNYDYVVTVSEPVSGCAVTGLVPVRVQRPVATALANVTRVCGSGQVQLRATVSGTSPAYVGSNTDDYYIPSVFNINQAPTSPLTLSNLPGPIPSTPGAVRVTLNIDHRFLRDVVITLRSPGGPTITLKDLYEGNYQGTGLQSTVFTDAAATTLTAGSPPYTGEYKPYEPLSALAGTNPNGTWRLSITPLTNGGYTSGGIYYPSEGWLRDWQVSINYDTYQWTGPNGFTSNQPAPTANVPATAAVGPQLYQLVYGGPDGCTTTSRVSVDLQRPVAQATVTPPTLCVGRGTVPVQVQFNSVRSAMAQMPSTAAPLTVPGALSSSTPAVARMPVLVQNMSTLTSYTAWSVRLNLTCADTRTITLRLLGPGGSPAVELARRPGGSQGANFTNTVFASYASAAITTSAAPFTGDFVPRSPMPSLNGLNPNGTWELEVSNYSNNPVQLNDWTLGLGDFSYTWREAGSFTNYGGGTVTSYSAGVNTATVGPKTLELQVTNTLTGCQSAPTTAVVNVVDEVRWLGTASTDWQNAANWSGCVPDSLISVTFDGSETSFPQLSSGVGMVKDMFMVANTAVNVSNSATLAVYGALWEQYSGAGLIFSGNSTLSFRGPGGLRLIYAGPITVPNLDVKLSPGTTSNLRNSNIPFNVSGAVTLRRGTVEIWPLNLGPNATFAETGTGYLLGQVTATRTLSAATPSSNFGGIGLQLGPGVAPVSTWPGAVTVSRVTAWPLLLGQAGNSIQRYFDISASQTGFGPLQADFRYADRELGGLSENVLGVFRQEGNGPWQRRGFTARDAVANSVVLDGITAFSIWTLGDNTRNPLPVELTRFTAEREGEAARLRWSTASERNCARWEVERSTDGGRSFVQIATLVGQGTRSMPTDYTYRDAELGAAPGESLVYYRLRQVDTDGTATYSPVRAVTAPPLRSLSAQLWPNPVGNQADAPRLRLFCPATASVTVQVLDGVGKTVLSRSLPAGAGVREETLPELQALPAGLYAVLVKQGATRLTLKLVRE